MMFNTSDKINFYFPDITPANKDGFVKALTNNVPDDPETGFAGFSEKDYLVENLLSRYDKKDLPKYKKIDTASEKRIESVIRKTLEKCLEKITSEKKIIISIFPGLSDYDEFEGVNGFTPYEFSFILYISQTFSEKSLIETVAHEFNHALFFAYHPSPQTLLDSLVSEGCAENFREEVVGGESAPWTKALTSEECTEAFKLLHDSLDREDMYEDVFWNDKKFKKWTGYSIGYAIVKQFKAHEKDISWDEIIKMDSKIILEKSGYLK